MTDLIKNYYSMSNIPQKIMFEYLSGDWSKFFSTWSTSFSPDIKKMNDYKILTFKLRVHFAILPIRIIQLHQNNFCDINKSSKISDILKNFAKRLNTENHTVMDFEEEENKLTLDSMKQLESFLNSEDGLKLAEELKDSTLRIFFALPYIVNPYEDDSMKNIFSINWLEELTNDLEIFITRYFYKFPSEEDLKTFNNDLLYLPAQLTIDETSHDQNILSENKKNMSCNKALNSAIKSKQVEDWIANHPQVIEDTHMQTKSTQTLLSDIKNTDNSTLGNNSNILMSNYLYDSNNDQYSVNELSITKSRLFSVHKHYKKLKMRFHQLHEDYQKMNEIAEELTLALENSVRGQPVNFDIIMQTCMKIFPDRFDRDIQTDSEDTSLDIKEDISETILNTKKDYKAVNDILVSPETLDYKKIKFHLKSKDVSTKLPLLQALRHKLTLNELDHRNKTIFEYTKNDLLELEESSLNLDENFLVSLLQENNLENSQNFLQQTTSRFLNAMASFNIGRTYLTSGPTVLNAIIHYLNGCNKGNTDSITLDMLIATLQKMSLRKQQREYMIEANLVEWLIYHLNNEKFEMGNYRLEYICALLMNLSLQRDARSRASTLAPLFVSIMANLFTSDYNSILPYLNGALQNFLLDDEINNEAKKINFSKIIEYHCMNCNQELRPHFSHTLKIHKRECNENLSDDEFPDEDNDTLDVLEKELEQKDPVIIKSEELQGENLLAEHYCISNFSLDSKKIFVKRVDDISHARNENQSFRESKKTRLNASMINAASETTLDDFKTETTEKKSGTGGLAKPKKFSINKHDERHLFKKSDDPFLAKPKLMRTPPCSARKEQNHVNKIKRFRNKVK